MLTTTRTMRVAGALMALALCLAATTDPAHAQSRRAMQRKGGLTSVSRPGTTTTFTRQTVMVPVRGKSNPWRPPLINGDTDFGGNGPEVRIRVQFLLHDNAIYRRVFMQAVETHSTLGATFGDNITTVSGWSPREKVWTPPAGQMIVQLGGISEKTDLVGEVLKGHKPHYRNTAVGRMEIFADRKGGDAVRYTGVTVDFNYDLPVVVQNATSRFAQVHLPRTVRYDPPLIEGDGDFKGHGPWVTVSVYLTNSDRQVNFVLFMKARETKNDFTTAAGYKTEVIYRAPAGKRIKTIHGKKLWRDVVNYVDDDHEIDRFRHPDLGRILVEGDTFGDDVPGRGTKVIFEDIQHMVLVELEDA